MTVALGLLWTPPAGPARASEPVPQSAWQGFGFVTGSSFRLRQLPIKSEACLLKSLDSHCGCEVLELHKMPAVRGKARAKPAETVRGLLLSQGHNFWAIHDPANHWSSCLRLLFGSFGTRAVRLILSFCLISPVAESTLKTRLCLFDQGSDRGVLRQLAPVNSMETLRSVREACKGISIALQLSRSNVLSSNSSISCSPERVHPQRNPQ